MATTELPQLPQYSSSTKIQSVVQSQLPEFIQSDYPKFVAFLKAYYEYMDIIDDRDIIELRDIDSTVDSFISYFKGELGYNVPDLENIDMRLFLRKSKLAFTSKGTEESYKFLFRVLFNKNVEISYPWDSVLKCSDGKWNRDTSMFVQFPTVMEVTAAQMFAGVTYTIIALGSTNFIEYGATSNNLNTTFVATKDGVPTAGTGIVSTPDEAQAINAVNSFVGNKVTVTSPGKFINVYVDRILRIRERVFELFIDKNYYGNIEIGDVVKYNDYTVNIAPTTVHYNILSPGQGYKLGELIYGTTIAGNTTVTQTLKVTDVNSTGGIVSVQPVKFGCGYTEDFYVLTTKDSSANKSTLNIKSNGVSVYNPPEEGVEGYSDFGSVSSPTVIAFNNAVAGVGTISVSLGGTTVTGVGTSFATSGGLGTVFRGDVLRNAAGTIIGTVTAIASATSLTITAAAVAVTAGAYSVVNSYSAPTYAGSNGLTAGLPNDSSTYQTFYDQTVNGSLDVNNLALIQCIIGGSAKYQGYWTSNDGFLSDVIKIQDSVYYQKFSYLLTVDEQIEAYRSYVKAFLHSSGNIMYGEYQIYNTYDAGVTGRMIMGVE